MLAKGFWRAPARMAFVTASREWLLEHDLCDHADRVVRGLPPHPAGFALPKGFTAWDPGAAAMLPDEALEHDARALARAILSHLPDAQRAKTEGGSVQLIELDARTGALRVLVEGPLLDQVIEGSEFPTLWTLFTSRDQPGLEPF